MSARTATALFDQRRLDSASLGQLFVEAISRRARSGSTPERSNFPVNLSYGDPAGLFPRNPRLDFDAACRIE
jgi:hypothetical protein